MSSNGPQSPASPISVLMLMRLFPAMMPHYTIPPRPAEGLPPLYKLIQGLVKAGHTVHFAGVVNPAIDAIPQRGDSKEPFRVDGVYYYQLQLPFSQKVAALRAIKPLRFGFAIYKHLRLLWEISALIRKIRPQLLYVGGPYHLFGGLCGKLYGTPTVLRFYGVHNLRELRGRLSSYLSDPWAMLAFRTPFDLAVITNDGTYGDKVAHSFHIPPEKVRFWINGVDKGVYDPDFDPKTFLRNLGIDSEHKVILSIDRLQDWKRQDRIIRMMPQVVDRVPQALLFLVGNGPERHNLEGLARSLGVEKYVRFLGAVPHSEVFALMQAADVYVSVHDLANLPNGLWEAMLCGCCVVSVNDGASDGLMTHDQELVLLDPEKVDTQLPPALVELLEDGPRRRRLGAAARAFAETKLDSWEERIAREVVIIEALAKRRKSPRQYT